MAFPYIQISFTKYKWTGTPGSSYSKLKALSLSHQIKLKGLKTLLTWVGIQHIWVQYNFYFYFYKTNTFIEIKKNRSHTQDVYAVYKYKQ